MGFTPLEQVAAYEMAVAIVSDVLIPRVGDRVELRTTVPATVSVTPELIEEAYRIARTEKLQRRAPLYEIVPPRRKRQQVSAGETPPRAVLPSDPPAAPPTPSPGCPAPGTSPTADESHDLRLLKSPIASVRDAERPEREDGRSEQAEPVGPPERVSPPTWSPRRAEATPTPVRGAEKLKVPPPLKSREREPVVLPPSEPRHRVAALDLDYRAVTVPQEFSQLIESWSRQPRLFIDIEVADYYTKAARVASLQVRDSEGLVTVVDCISPQTQAQLCAEFIPKVMCEPSVEKWAHNAQYERRFLGGDAVKNLNCTLALAKRLPYYRLPLRSCSMASLVSYFWGLHIDKSFQTISWGQRPLPPAAWAYAAWDAEWCYRLWSELLQRLAEHKVPGSPKAIAKRFAEFSADYRAARKRRGAIWQGVREHMIGEELPRLGGFKLSRRETARIQFDVLVASLERADPHSLVPCPLSLTRSQHETLGRAADAVKRESELTGGTRFSVPREERTHETVEYDLDITDLVAVERDFAEADHQQRLLGSEREILKARMKAIMIAEGRDELLGFTLTHGEPTHWRIEPRLLARIAPGCDVGLLRLVAKARTLFERAGIELPEDGVETTTGWTLRWRPETPTDRQTAALAHDLELERQDGGPDAEGE